MCRRSPTISAWRTFCPILNIFEFSRPKCEILFHIFHTNWRIVISYFFENLKKFYFFIFFNTWAVGLIRCGLRPAAASPMLGTGPIEVGPIRWRELKSPNWGANDCWPKFERPNIFKRLKPIKLCRLTALPSDPKTIFKNFQKILFW